MLSVDTNKEVMLLLSSGLAGRSLAGSSSSDSSVSELDAVSGGLDYK